MKKFFRIFLILLILVAAFVIYLVVNAFRHTSKQVQVQAAEVVSVDDNTLAAHLAQAVRFQTVSFTDPTQVKTEEFLNLHKFLEETYPLVHAKLTREVIADYSLLYTWKGSDPAQKPVLLMAHQDVVPIEPGTEARWTHPPFDGQIADGFVWGRGSLDDKCTMIGILEAVEMLLREGYQPRRTIYLAFGHDEEIGGLRGAPAIAETLRTRGVELESVLDEGGAITEGVIKGLSKPAAVVGTGEKGFMSVQLSVEIEGGHSSTPPPQTAVGIVSAAVAHLEENQMPARLDGATEEMLSYLGPEMNFVQRTAIANLRLFRPLILRQFTSIPATNAAVRTTTAATVIEGGVKDNVLPSHARAVVNFRILPGDTTASVLEHVRTVVNDPRVKIEILPDSAVSEPSPVSSADSQGYKTIERTIRQIFPQAVVAPYLVLGATDSRRYSRVSANIYRFTPIELHPEDLERVHGTNERISVVNFAQCVKFYRQLIKNYDS